jgi:AAA domain
MILPSTTTPKKTDLSDLTLFVYGPPKIGKTTLAAGAKDALFFATESGLNALEVFQLPIATWDELLAAAAELAKGNHRFRTIVIDTIDQAYLRCAEFVLRKFNIQHESDLPYGKGYVLINSEFARVLHKLVLQPSGLIMISHAKNIDIDTRTGKHVKAVPTLPEKARQIVLGISDVILYCDFDVTRSSDGQQAVRRVMRTKPSAHYEAGDRTGRLPETIDMNYNAFLAAFRNATQALSE